MALGSPMYMCPEIVNKDPYDNRCDVWAIGVTAYILITGCPPFYAESRKDLNKAILRDKVDFTEETFGKDCTDCISFIEACLTKKQANRPFIKDLLNHKWITEISETQIDAEKQTQISKNLLSF